MKTREERIDMKKYLKGIALYEQGLKNIQDAIGVFKDTSWGVPEYLDTLFGDGQGNEELWNLQKEVKHLKEDLETL